MKGIMINGVLCLITPKDPRYNSNDPSIKKVSCPKKPDEDPGEGMIWKVKYEETDTEIIGSWIAVEDKKPRINHKNFFEKMKENMIKKAEEINSNKKEASKNEET